MRGHSNINNNFKNFCQYLGILFRPNPTNIVSRYILLSEPCVLRNLETRRGTSPHLKPGYITTRCSWAVVPAGLSLNIGSTKFVSARMWRYHANVTRKIRYDVRHVARVPHANVTRTFFFAFDFISTVYLSGIEDDVFDELDGPLELICWSPVVWRVLLLRPKRRLARCVLHSVQSSRTCSGVWLASRHAHHAYSDWFIRFRCAILTSLCLAAHFNLPVSLPTV
jgi:hypothetical protein